MTLLLLVGQGTPRRIAGGIVRALRARPKLPSYACELPVRVARPVVRVRERLGAELVAELIRDYQARLVSQAGW